MSPAVAGSSMAIHFLTERQSCFGRVRTIVLTREYLMLNPLVLNPAKHNGQAQGLSKNGLDDS